MTTTMLTVSHHTEHAKASSSDNWPMFQYSATHCGYRTPYYDVQYPNSVSNSSWHCSDELNGTIIEGSPAIVDGVVYVESYEDSFEGCFTFVYALNASTLEVLWKQTLNDYRWPQGSCGSPAVSNGKVFVTTCGFQSAWLYALNATANGTVVWAFTMPTICTT